LTTGVGYASVRIQLPKLRPKIFIARMKIGIARQDGPAIRPSFLGFYQPGANEISQNVKTDFRKRAAPSLVLAQDMVVRLMLKVMRAQRNAKMFAQKFHAVSLVAIAPQSHPEQMNVIRHETIGWTKQTFSGGGVQHHFPKAGMKKFVEPADAAAGGALSNESRHCLDNVHDPSAEGRRSGLFHCRKTDGPHRWLARIA
jgi:hypothetical protein